MTCFRKAWRLSKSQSFKMSVPRERSTAKDGAVQHLQDALVAVEQGQWRLRGHVISRALPVVSYVVGRRGEQGREYFAVTEQISRLAEIAEVVEEAIENIRGVHAVVVGICAEVSRLQAAQNAFQ